MSSLVDIEHQHSVEIAGTSVLPLSELLQDFANTFDLNNFSNHVLSTPIVDGDPLENFIFEDEDPREKEYEMSKEAANLYQPIASVDHITDWESDEEQLESFSSVVDHFAATAAGQEVTILDDNEVSRLRSTHKRVPFYPFLKAFIPMICLQFFFSFVRLAIPGVPFPSFAEQSIGASCAWLLSNGYAELIANHSATTQPTVAHYLFRTDAGGNVTFSIWDINQIPKRFNFMLPQIDAQLVPIALEHSFFSSPHPDIKLKIPDDLCKPGQTPYLSPDAIVLSISTKAYWRMKYQAMGVALPVKLDEEFNMYAKRNNYPLDLVDYLPIPCIVVYDLTTSIAKQQGAAGEVYKIRKLSDRKSKYTKLSSLLSQTLMVPSIVCYELVSIQASARYIKKLEKDSASTENHPYLLSRLLPSSVHQLLSNQLLSRVNSPGFYDSLSTAINTRKCLTCGQPMLPGSDTFGGYCALHVQFNNPNTMASIQLVKWPTAAALTLATTVPMHFLVGSQMKSSLNICSSATPCRDGLQFKLTCLAVEQFNRKKRSWAESSFRTPLCGIIKDKVFFLGSPEANFADFEQIVEPRHVCRVNLPDMTLNGLQLLAMCCPWLSPSTPLCLSSNKSSKHLSISSLQDKVSSGIFMSRPIGLSFEQGVAILCEEKFINQLQPVLNELMDQSDVLSRRQSESGDKSSIKAELKLLGRSKDAMSQLAKLNQASQEDRIVSLGAWCITKSHSQPDMALLSLAWPMYKILVLHLLASGYCLIDAVEVFNLLPEFMSRLIVHPQPQLSIPDMLLHLIYGGDITAALAECLALTMLACNMVDGITCTSSLETGVLNMAMSNFSGIATKIVTNSGSWMGNSKQHGAQPRAYGTQFGIDWSKAISLSTSLTAAQGHGVLQPQLPKSSWLPVKRTFVTWIKSIFVQVPQLIKPVASTTGKQIYKNLEILAQGDPLLAKASDYIDKLSLLNLSDVISFMFRLWVPFKLPGLLPTDYALMASNCTTKYLFTLWIKRLTRVKMDEKLLILERILDSRLATWGFSQQTVQSFLSTIHNELISDPLFKMYTSQIVCNSCSCVNFKQHRICVQETTVPSNLSLSLPADFLMQLAVMWHWDTRLERKLDDLGTTLVEASATLPPGNFLVSHQGFLLFGQSHASKEVSLVDMETGCAYSIPKLSTLAAQQPALKFEQLDVLIDTYNATVLNSLKIGEAQKTLIEQQAVYSVKGELVQSSLNAFMWFRSMTEATDFKVISYSEPLDPLYSDLKCDSIGINTELGTIGNITIPKVALDQQKYLITLCTMLFLICSLNLERDHLLPGFLKWCMYCVMFLSDKTPLGSLTNARYRLFTQLTALGNYPITDGSKQPELTNMSNSGCITSEMLRIQMLLESWWQLCLQYPWVVHMIEFIEQKSFDQLTQRLATQGVISAATKITKFSLISAFKTLVHNLGCIPTPVGKTGLLAFNTMKPIVSLNLSSFGVIDLYTLYQSVYGVMKRTMRPDDYLKGIAQAINDHDHSAFYKLDGTLHVNANKTLMTTLTSLLPTYKRSIPPQVPLSWLTDEANLLIKNERKASNICLTVGWKHFGAYIAPIQQINMLVKHFGTLENPLSIKFIDISGELQGAFAAMSSYMNAPGLLNDQPHIFDITHPGSGTLLAFFNELIELRFPLLGLDRFCTHLKQTGWVPNTSHLTSYLQAHAMHAFPTFNELCQIDKSLFGKVRMVHVNLNQLYDQFKTYVLWLGSHFVANSKRGILAYFHLLQQFEKASDSLTAFNALCVKHNVSYLLAKQTLFGQLLSTFNFPALTVATQPREQFIEQTKRATAVNPSLSIMAQQLANLLQNPTVGHVFLLFDHELTGLYQMLVKKRQTPAQFPLKLSPESLTNGMFVNMFHGPNKLDPISSTWLSCSRSFCGKVYNYLFMKNEYKQREITAANGCLRLGISALDKVFEVLSKSLVGDLTYKPEIKYNFIDHFQQRLYEGHSLAYNNGAFSPYHTSRLTMKQTSKLPSIMYAAMGTKWIYNYLIAHKLNFQTPQLQAEIEATNFLRLSPSTSSDISAVVEYTPVFLITQAKCRVIICNTTDIALHWPNLISSSQPNKYCVLDLVRFEPFVKLKDQLANMQFAPTLQQALLITSNMTQSLLQCTFPTRSDKYGLYSNSHNMLVVDKLATDTLLNSPLFINDSNLAEYVAVLKVERATIFNRFMIDLKRDSHQVDRISSVLLAISHHYSQRDTRRILLETLSIDNYYTKGSKGKSLHKIMNLSYMDITHKLPYKIMIQKEGRHRTLHFGTQSKIKGPCYPEAQALISMNTPARWVPSVSVARPSCMNQPNISAGLSAIIQLICAKFRHIVLNYDPLPQLPKDTFVTPTQIGSDNDVILQLSTWASQLLTQQMYEELSQFCQHLSQTTCIGLFDPTLQFKELAQPSTITIWSIRPLMKVLLPAIATTYDYTLVTTHEPIIGNIIRKAFPFTSDFTRFNMSMPPRLLHLLTLCCPTAGLRELVDNVLSCWEDKVFQVPEYYWSSKHSETMAKTYIGEDNVQMSDHYGYKTLDAALTQELCGPHLSYGQIWLPNIMSQGMFGSMSSSITAIMMGIACRQLYDMDEPTLSNIGIPPEDQKQLWSSGGMCAVTGNTSDDGAGFFQFCFKNLKVDGKKVLKANWSTFGAVLNGFGLKFSLSKCLAFPNVGLMELNSKIAVFGSNEAMPRVMFNVPQVALSQGGKIANLPSLLNLHQTKAFSTLTYSGNRSLVLTMSRLENKHLVRTLGFDQWQQPLRQLFSFLNLETWADLEWMSFVLGYPEVKLKALLDAAQTISERTTAFLFFLLYCDTASAFNSAALCQVDYAPLSPTARFAMKNLQGQLLASVMSSAMTGDVTRTMVSSRIYTAMSSGDTEFDSFGIQHGLATMRKYLIAGKIKVQDFEIPVERFVISLSNKLAFAKHTMARCAESVSIQPITISPLLHSTSYANSPARFATYIVPADPYLTGLFGQIEQTLYVVLTTTMQSLLHSNEIGLVEMLVVMKQVENATTEKYKQIISIICVLLSKFYGLNIATLTGCFFVATTALPPEHHVQMFDGSTSNLLVDIEKDLELDNNIKGLPGGSQAFNRARFSRLQVFIDSISPSMAKCAMNASALITTRQIFNSFQKIKTICIQTGFFRTHLSHVLNGGPIGEITQFAFPRLDHQLIKQDKQVISAAGRCFGGLTIIEKVFTSDGRFKPSGQYLFKNETTSESIVEAGLQPDSLSGFKTAIVPPRKNYSGRLAATICQSGSNQLAIFSGGGNTFFKCDMEIEGMPSLAPTFQLLCASAQYRYSGITIGIQLAHLDSKSLGMIIGDTTSWQTKVLAYKKLKGHVWEYLSCTMNNLSYLAASYYYIVVCECFTEIQLSPSKIIIDPAKNSITFEDVHVKMLNPVIAKFLPGDVEQIQVMEAFNAVGALGLELALDPIGYLRQHLQENDRFLESNLPEAQRFKEFRYLHELEIYVSNAVILHHYVEEPSYEPAIGVAALSYIASNPICCHYQGAFNDTLIMQELKQRGWTSTIKVLN